ncbi:MAG TPA: hypothetical protein VG713_19915 [Pirellulales bacterium]|nr:hypothetical protein [Pirellulales bacterium]
MNTTSANPGLATLPRISRNVRLLPSVDRRPDGTDPVLIRLFARLVSGRAPWPLYLHGPVGRGKTLAALCLCDVARSAAYFTAEGLCDTATELKLRPDELRDFWETVAAKDLAVLDEIGLRGEPSDFAYTTLKRFLDARELCGQRRAIYISNLAPKNLAKLYDDRICSRLFCGSRFELHGSDRRFA